MPTTLYTTSKSDLTEILKLIPHRRLKWMDHYVLPFSYLLYDNIISSMPGHCKLLTSMFP